MCFTLLLILAVLVMKKVRFNRVIGVEQNLNTHRIFNSTFTYGPGICIIIGILQLTLMCSERMFAPNKTQNPAVFQCGAKKRLLSFLTIQTFCAIIPYFSSDHLRSFTRKRMKNKWNSTMPSFARDNRVNQNPMYVLN